MYHSDNNDSENQSRQQCPTALHHRRTEAALKNDFENAV